MARTKTLKPAETSEIQKKDYLEAKREIAKIGLSASLFLTAGSALFLKNKTAKTIHITAGIALVGFSLWHASLYPKLSPKKS